MGTQTRYWDFDRELVSGREAQIIDAIAQSTLASLMAAKIAAQVAAGEDVELAAEADPQFVKSVARLMDRCFPDLQFRVLDRPRPPAPSR